MDSSGYDIAQASTIGGNWTTAAAACSANAYCVAVNTGGYLKYQLKDQAQWSSAYGDPCQGLLVKQSEWAELHQHSVVACTVTGLGGWCVYASMLSVPACDWLVFG